MIAKRRNVVFALLGATGLVLKRHYSGPLAETVHSYLGNVAASFAVYFVVTNLPLPPRLRRALTVVLAFAVVSLFEAFDGFGVMANVYDRNDFTANAVGVALAVVVDVVSDAASRQRSKQGERGPSAPHG